MEKFHAKKLEDIGDLEKRPSIAGWMKDLLPVTSPAPINPMKQ